MRMSEKIKAARVALGLSRREFAHLVGCHLAQVTDWEVRGRMPRPTTLQKISDILGVYMEDLMSDPEATR